MKRILLSALSVCFITFGAVHPAFSKTEEIKGHHWGYEGEIGPENWAKLNPEYFWCGLKNQSPININKNDKVISILPKLRLNYGKTEKPEIINNGHTIQVNISEDFSFEIRGKKYKLVQFHFHTPSEHTVEGNFYPMEMHLVHKDKDGNIAVIGIFIKEGKRNSELEKVFNNSPSEEGKQVLNDKIDLNNLLPKNKSYYTYSGSLTTPPCTEGVRWIVLKKAITASKRQIEKFKSIMKINNNRPVQPINSRIILESK